MSTDRLPHLIVTGFFGTDKYTAAQRRGPDFNVPARDRTAHGTSVREQLQKVRGENAESRGLTPDGEKSPPIVIEVRSEPGFLLKLESLEDRRKGIEVACVQQEGDVQVATVQVPEGALTHFLKRAEEYLNADTKGTEKTPAKPKHQELIATIGEIRLATLQSFWTDEAAEFPPPDKALWWEAWVRVVGGHGMWDSFRLLAEAAGLTVGQDTIRFPDRVVGLVYGSAEQLMASADLLDLIGEVRRAKENPADFLALAPKDQAEWVTALLARLTPPPAAAPYVCVLDGGVVINPLLAPALDPADCHRYDPKWPVADVPGRPLTRSHGTEMAGVVLYGRRQAALLAGGELHALTHRLESVRVLPPKPYENERRLYGAITAEAVGRVEITAPDRVRSFCMALTTGGRDRGRPSSWSGIVDQVCGGYADQNPRLFFVAAGNTDPNERHRYPESNDTDTVQEPGQAWNAITVGACTDCVTFDQTAFPSHAPLAPVGDLSPSSTTSLTWEKPWPYKPDFVLEGGNEIIRDDKRTVMDPDEMAMLTTAHAAAGALLTDFRDTSAATAQAAGMAAALQAEYPALWPETIRGLLIHSATWTDRMRAAFGAKKADHAARLRRYGYGIPNLARARDSARDALTLVVEQSIRPFAKEGSDIKTNEMGLHALPWPKEQLSEHTDARVTLRVTLSYFIEPKPGRREGFVKHRHRYQSHGLRFEVKRPQETLDDLRKRVSQAARTEEEDFEVVGDTSGWEIGPKLRTRGSVHCDWWTGTAADLANCGVIAVYPVSGWWRESKGNDWSKEARYALLVSIRTEAVAVPVSMFTPTTIDLYTPIEATIMAAAEQSVPTEVEDVGDDFDAL